MPLPTKLSNLAEAAGLELVTSEQGALKCVMSLPNGGSEDVLIWNATGAPDELQAIILTAPNIYKYSLNPQTGRNEMIISPLSDEFFNELLEANDERGIGAFSMIMQGAIRIFQYSATISLKDLSPGGLKAAFQSVASMAHEYQERLNAV